MGFMENAKKLLSSCCFGKKNEAEYEEEQEKTEEEKLQDFRELVSDPSNFSLNINDENFLHYLLWEFSEEESKLEFIKIFNESKLTSEDKKKLFLQENKDGETPLEYFAETMVETQVNIKNAEVLKDLFKGMDLSDRIELLSTKEAKGYQENIGHVMSNFNEQMFIEALFERDGKILDLDTLDENELNKIAELLKIKDEDNESIYTCLTDESEANLTNKEITNGIKNVLEEANKAMQSRQIQSRQSNTAKKTNTNAQKM